MAIWCLRLAGIYLLAGMAMGIGTGAAQNFALVAAHAHINLLGWVTLAPAAVIFTVRSDTSTARLAWSFCWLCNLALPPTVLGLSLELLGHTQWTPVAMAVQLALYAAAILFVANLIVSARAALVAAHRPGVGVRRRGAAVVADAG